MAPVDTELRFSTIGVGEGFACAIEKADPAGAGGRLYCWGHGHRGQTALGVSDALTPETVPVPRSVPAR